MKDQTRRWEGDCPWKRVVLKLSGEALADSAGENISGEVLQNLASEISAVRETHDVDIAIVVVLVVLLVVAVLRLGSRPVTGHADSRDGRARRCPGWVLGGAFSPPFDRYGAAWPAAPKSQLDSQQVVGRKRGGST